MRPLLLALLPALLSAAPALEIVRPIVSQMDGGPPEPSGFEHLAGETLWVMCRVAGYSKSEDQHVHLKYSIQAFDSKGVPLDEPYSNDMKAEVSAQDKEWLPRIATSVPIPPLAAPGAYKVVVKVEDALAKTTAELAIPFKVRGHAIEASETLVVRNFRFFRDEEGTRPADKPFYKPGDGVFARFDIVGYKFGEKNKIDVSYVTSVIAPSGKVLVDPARAGHRYFRIVLPQELRAGRDGNQSAEDHPPRRVRHRRAGEGRRRRPDVRGQISLHHRVETGTSRRSGV